MLQPKKKREAREMAEDLCKLDHQNQVIVDHSIQLLLASQTLHDQKKLPTRPARQAGLRRR